MPDKFTIWLNTNLSVVVVDIAIVLGIIKVLTWIWRFLAMVWRQKFRACCQKKDRNMDRYGSKDGSKTWAVVTGGSDGIGLGICKKLAKEGFNICIVARTQSKMDEKLNEIKTECRANDDSFETLSVVAYMTNLIKLP